jgi:mannose-1-phosphate guanylyltransferase
MASAIVLCAGFGTRLRPLTDELPKPLVPVGDGSILEHAARALAAAGFREVTLNVHHLRAAFDRYLGRLALPARVIEEAEILGTAGGVAGARPFFDGAPVLVWNGDILVDPPIAALLAGAADGAFCFGVAPRPRGEGTVGLDEQGQVVRLRGERFGLEAQGGDYVGVLALGAAACDALPARGCVFGDAALPHLRAGGIVKSVPVTRPWTDAGDAPGLLRANLAWLAARGLDSFVGPGAEVLPGVTLSQSVVSTGARVIGQGGLERCVICPGATAVAPLSDAIVAPSGNVMRARA